jgi:predicted RNA-binding Zn-ribbon protein involved in translation (DUF1610 family)
MKTSESIIKIAPALLAAQKEIGSASKDAVNPFFKSKYADLGSVMEACKEALNKNGITVLQPVSTDGMGTTLLETILLHESGEFISDTMSVTIKQQNDPQAQGSAITYARRYSLQSMVFIPAEDDDAEKATNHAVNTPTSQSKTVSAKSTTTDVKCPKCGGEVWDNTQNKLNPKSPDYKCKDPNCKDAKGYVTGFWKPKNENAPHDAEGNEMEEKYTNEQPPVEAYQEEIDIEEVFN